MTFVGKFVGQLLITRLEFRSFRVFGIVHNRAGTASIEIKFSNWNLIVGAGGGIRRNRAKHTVIDPASIVRNIIRWTR